MEKKGVRVLSKKQQRYFLVSFLILAILIVGIFVVNAAIDNSIKSHDASQINVRLIGYLQPSMQTTDLKTAIDNGWFRGDFGKSVEGVSSVIPVGHDFSQVLVYVSSQTLPQKTLKEAIAQGNLCGTLGDTPSPSADFVGMLSTQIDIGNGKTLQDGINEGTIAKAPGGWSGWSYYYLTPWSEKECIGACGAGATQENTVIRNRKCNSPAPFCGGSNCVPDNPCPWGWSCTSSGDGENLIETQVRTETRSCFKTCPDVYVGGPWTGWSGDCKPDDWGGWKEVYCPAGYGYIVPGSVKIAREATWFNDGIVDYSTGVVPNTAEWNARITINCESTSTTPKCVYTTYGVMYEIIDGFKVPRWDIEHCRHDAFYTRLSVGMTCRQQTW